MKNVLNYWAVERIGKRDVRKDKGRKGIED